ncbi:GAF domain-containing protein [Actinocorallia lasiicapitis]
MTVTQISPDRVTELERRIREEGNARKRLVDIAVKLNSTLDTTKLLQLVMQMAAELLDAETASLLLVDRDSGDLVIEVATGTVGHKVMSRRIPAGEGIAGWTLTQREVAIIDDPRSDQRFFTEVGKAIQFETRNLLAVPLLVKDRAVGVIEVLNKRGEAAFTSWDAELATAFAALAALAVDNATMYAQLSDAVLTARMSYRL